LEGESHSQQLTTHQHGSKPSAELTERTNGIRKPWIDYFSITTGRRASMSANPRINRRTSQRNLVLRKWLV
jgi:hypothetical protein